MLWNKPSLHNFYSKFARSFHHEGFMITLGCTLEKEVTFCQSRKDMVGPGKLGMGPLSHRMVSALWRSIGYFNKELFYTFTSHGWEFQLRHTCPPISCHFYLSHSNKYEMVSCWFFVLLWNNHMQKDLQYNLKNPFSWTTKSNLPTCPFHPEYFRDFLKTRAFFDTTRIQQKNHESSCRHYFQPLPGPHSILPSCRNDSLPDRKIQFRITKASGCHLSSGSFGLNTPILSPQVSWPWYMVMCQLSCKTSPNLSVSDLPHGWIQVVHLWHKNWYSSYVLSQSIPSGCPWFHFEHLTEVVAARLPHYAFPLCG